MTLLCFLVFALACPSAPAADSVARHLLPNGEPVVGVYYYPWYGGEPYRHVGWHPDFQYDNQRSPEQIREVLRAIADHGINQAAYSYWGDGSLPLYETHMREAETLLREGWPLYLSPYMEPPTIQKDFASPDAQQYNVDRLTHFLGSVGSSPAFCRLGDQPFTDIYVTYYVPDETDDDFRAFLRDRYGSPERLRAAWAMLDYPEALRGAAVPDDGLPAGWDGVTLAAARPGTVAFADRQELRARRLKQGWQAVLDGVKQRTGLDTRYTGDNSNTIVSPTRYMDALTGLGWYSFSYAMANPTRRPKLMSEIAKYTGTDFQYTISPGYVDRQQRWPGARVEHDPFLYEYAWVKALQTLPEGIMILTHSEWFEGSIIDVTREYGRKPYETTELYASVFKAAYDDAFRHKRARKPIAVVFNEWATYGVNERGRNLGDVYGLIKALECLSVDFDVIPESFLSAEELAGRKLLLVPSCGLSLHPDKAQLLADWVRDDANAHLITDATPFWAAAKATLGDQLLLAGERLGDRLAAAFDDAWSRGEVPEPQLRYLEKLVTTALDQSEVWWEGKRPSTSYEMARGPVVWAGDTAIVTVANTMPWSYITAHQTGGWGGGLTRSAELTFPWRREPFAFSVRLPVGKRVAQVRLLDSDGARLIGGPDPDIVPDARFDEETNTLTISAHAKFHAVYAIETGTVAMDPSGLEVYPGGRARVSVRLVNLSPDQAVEGTLELMTPPGLNCDPAPVTLAPSKAADVSLTLAAGPDCAVGNRTVVFKLSAGDSVNYYWYPLEVTEPALVGLKTGVVAAQVGKPREVALALANVGAEQAREVQVELLGARASVPSLDPGKDATVAVTIEAPAPDAQAPLPTELSWQAGDPPTVQGMTLPSDGDGVVRYREAGGLLGVEPDPTQPDTNRFIYFLIDKGKLPPGDYGAEAEIEYFDAVGGFLVEYDSALGDGIEQRFWDSEPVGLTGTDEWRTAVVPLPHARFAGRQNLGADLRVSGRVLVHRILLRPLRPRATTLNERVSITWKCGSGQFSTTAPLRVARVAEADPPAEALPGVPPLWVVNPYGSAVPECPVLLPGDALPAGLPDGPIAAVDGKGQRWPVLRFPDGSLRAVLPADPSNPLYLAPAGEESEGLMLRDRTVDLGYLAVQTPRLGALWDARRGGCLMSLTDLANKHDYASPAAGACTVEYTMPDRAHHVSSQWPGSVKLADHSPLHATVIATADGPDLRVEDQWRVYGASRLLRLERTITFTRDLTAADFCPLVLRLDPTYLGQVLPLGVGFQKEDDPKRGWLESFHSEGWYFAFGGEPHAAADAVALVVGRADHLRRVRCGFIPADELPEAADPRHPRLTRDELQIRLRAQAQHTAVLPWLDPSLQVPQWWDPPGQRVYRAGDKLIVHALLALGRGCSWRVAEQLALIREYGATGSFSQEPTPGGLQIPELTAPRYMYRVHPSYPSAALSVEREPCQAPEVAGFAD